MAAEAAELESTTVVDTATEEETKVEVVEEKPLDEVTDKEEK